MNAQERDQLNLLLKQLVDFKVSTKDAEAETLIREAAARQPDAAYLLIQRAMLLEQGLNNAKARIDELQRQLQNSQSGQSAPGFLGNDPWAAPAAGSGQVPGAANYQPSRYAPPMQGQPQPQPHAGGGFMGGGSSFLGNIATTAAGVAAGGLLFQGLENLMGHHNSGFGQGGFGQAGFGQQGFGEQYPEQTVINNYYGDDNGGQLADNSSYSDDSYASDDSDYQDDGSSDF
ncbi:MAG: DUF2076 family protein [Methylococcales bacterium]|nr:DUF2076 family protein [Methylococcales bacterium]